MLLDTLAKTDCNGIYYLDGKVPKSRKISNRRSKEFLKKVIGWDGESIIT